MERIRGGWGNVPEHLKCKTDLREMGLKPVGQVIAEVWNSYMWVQLYDISETTPRKPPTEKQLAAIQKANEARQRLRTCHRCGELQQYKHDLMNGICEGCRFQEWLQKQEEQARQQFVDWWSTRDQYVILDTETTGLDGHDEIVEIAIIDLDGTVLLDTLVKPTVPIREAVQNVHGISEEDVEDAPTFADIADQFQQIIAGKTVLIYNADFDSRMIYQSGIIYGLNISFTSNCVMETYAQYYGEYSDYHRSFRWIKLADATDYEGVGGFQTHRAVDDCHLVRELIQSIAERGSSIHECTESAS